MTRDSEVLPATDDPRAAALSRRSPATRTKADDAAKRLTFPLAFNDLLIGEPDRIFGDASGVVRSARAARPPRRASWSDFCPARSEGVRGRASREDEDHPARQHAPLPALGARSSHAGGSGAKIAAPPCGMFCFSLKTPLPYHVRVSYDERRHMHFELTRMSSRGQIVIPEATRKVLGVRIGTKFAIFTDGKNILLQPIAPPDVAGFKKIIAEAEKTKEQAQAKAKEARK